LAFLQPHIGYRELEEGNSEYVEQKRDSQLNAFECMPRSGKTPAAAAHEPLPAFLYYQCFLFSNMQNHSFQLEIINASLNIYLTMSLSELFR